MHSVNNKSHKFAMDHYMQIEMKKPSPLCFLGKLGFGQLPQRCFIFEVYLLHPTEVSGSKISSCFGTELIVAKPRAALVAQEGVQL